MKSKLSAFVLVIVLAAFAATPSTATPSASPCAPGAAYDPACDVNHDGIVNVLDVQLTADHWDQTGTWTGGGDGWLLAGNAGIDPTNNFVGTTDGQPLVIQPGVGNVGIGTTSPQSKLSVDGTGWFQGSSTPLPAAAGAGVAVGYVPAWQAGYLAAFDYGTYAPKNLLLQSPGGKVGIGVNDVTPLYAKLQIAAGAHEDGLRVDSAGGDGVHVSSAGTDGVSVNSAGDVGVYVGSAGNHGVFLGSVGGDGVLVYSADGIGIYADTTQASGQWGIYTPDGIHGSNVLVHSISLVAQVTGSDGLAPGDVVAVADIADPVPSSTVHTPLVRLAGGTFTNVVGVVESRLALTEKPNHVQPMEGEPRTEAPVSDLRSVDGPAQAGDYVAITVLGAAQVKVDSATPIEAGQRLTIAANGRTRPQGTIKVQLAGGEGTADIPESAPVIGVALEAATRSRSQAERKDGMVWVLVNPQ